MSLKHAQRVWDVLGRRDPLWATLTVPGKKGGRWDVDEYLAWGRDEITALLRYLEPRGLAARRETALDFGCGIGRLTRALAEHFSEVHGVDIAPSMIRRAEQLNSDVTGCRFHLNHSADLSLFADGRFDLVYSNITLQHIEPRYSRNYLREFIRVLRPGGALVFQLPTARDPKADIAARGIDGLKRALRSMAPDPLLRLYRRMRREPPMFAIPRDQVLALLEAGGGIVVDVQPDTWAAGWTGIRYCVTKG